MNKADKGRLLTVVGMVMMTVLILANLTPWAALTPYSMIVGIALFFIVEWVNKTPEDQSGLRFNTFLADLRKCGPLLWLVFPAVSSIGSELLGRALFGSQVIDHIMGRTSNLIDYDNFLMMVLRFAIGAWGEEIAFRGFLVGKGMKIIGFWPAVLLSSAVFALAHLASGNPAIVAFDLIGIFIDAIIYALIMRKTNNCMISTVAHFLVNMLGIIFIMVFFK